MRAAAVAVLLACACSRPDGRAQAQAGTTPPLEAGNETAMDPSALPGLAIVRLTRTVIFDAHVDASTPGETPIKLAVGGGARTDDATRVLGYGNRMDDAVLVVDYGARSPQTRPVVRTYTARIAVPRDRTMSWSLDLGDDYKLLVITRGFRPDPGGIAIDGRVKSNYQVGVAGNGFTGPTWYDFNPLAVGKPAVLQVIRDDAPNRSFLEYEEREIEAVADSAPAQAMAGTAEPAAALDQRWEAWPVTRKQGLP